MAEISQAAGARDLNARITARVANARLRARKAPASGGLLARSLGGRGGPNASAPAAPNSRPLPFETAPIISDGITPAGVLRPAGVGFVRAAQAPEGAAFNASETMLDGLNADGFWGVGYGQNGGYNPLNLALAVAKCARAAVPACARCKPALPWGAGLRATTARAHLATGARAPMLTCA